jgi:hypothetical protein
MPDGRIFVFLKKARDASQIGLFARFHQYSLIRITPPVKSQREAALEGNEKILP